MENAKKGVKGSWGKGVPQADQIDSEAYVYQGENKIIPFLGTHEKLHKVEKGHKEGKKGEVPVKIDIDKIDQSLVESVILPETQGGRSNDSPVRLGTVEDVNPVALVVTEDPLRYGSVNPAGFMVVVIRRKTPVGQNLNTVYSYPHGSPAFSHQYKELFVLKFRGNRKLPDKVEYRVATSAGLRLRGKFNLLPFGKTSSLGQLRQSHLGLTANAPGPVKLHRSFGIQMHRRIGIEGNKKAEKENGEPEKNHHVENIRCIDEKP